MPSCVALFTRAWIEILMRRKLQVRSKVALFTRAWIEMEKSLMSSVISLRRPLHEGVD